MRLPVFAAALAATLSAGGAASAWELRAGLDQAAAQACTEDGACFGVQCSAAGGWTPRWTARFLPFGDGAASEPILAIRMNGSRFALTSLTADGPAGSFAGAITGQDSALLEALQRGDAISVDPGRDYAVADFSLRGSRWAIGEVLALCDSGGPEVFVAAEEEQPATE